MVTNVNTTDLKQQLIADIEIILPLIVVSLCAYRFLLTASVTLEYTTTSKVKSL